MRRFNGFVTAERHPVTIAGVAIVMFATALLFLTDSQVPNDPNIGAGVLLIVGVSTFIAGFTTERAEHDVPPPPQSNH